MVSAEISLFAMTSTYVCSTRNTSKSNQRSHTQLDSKKHNTEFQDSVSDNYTQRKLNTH